MSSIHGRCCVDTLFWWTPSLVKMENDTWLGHSFVICALGLEVGHPLSTENIKIHSKVTTTSEVGAIISCGIKTCVDTSWECLIFFYVTRCGASLSSLVELSCFGLAETQATGVCPAPSSQQVATFTTSCTFFGILPARMCLMLLLITIESNRYCISNQQHLATPVDRAEDSTLDDESHEPKKAVRFHLHIHFMIIQRFPNSFWGAECRSQGEFFF